MHRGHGRAGRSEDLRPSLRAALVRAGIVRRLGHVRPRGRRDQGGRAAGLLPRDPAVPVRHGRRGPDRGRAHEGGADRGREAVRARSRVGPSARRTAARVRRRIAALPHRPLPREDGARGVAVPAVREHDARTGLEPQLPRMRPDHHGRELRRRGPWPLLRPGGRASRRRRQPPHAGRRGVRHGGARRRRPGDARQRKAEPLSGDRAGQPGPLRPRPVRRLPQDRRRRGRLDHRDLRRAPARHRQLALRRRAVLHPHREAPADHADRASARVQAPAEARLPHDRRPRPGAGPARGQARPDDGRPVADRRPPRRRAPPRGDHPRHGVRAGGRRGADPLRGAPARGHAGRQQPVHASGRRRADLADHAAAAGLPPPVHPYAPGSWGPAAADELVAGHGRWHDPWVSA